MTKLSLKQAAVVASPIGQAMLVEAGAGAGKTRVLTERVRFIIENTRQDGVLALTFTNRAAEELQSRLDDIEDLAERCWVSTIHSIAQRILSQYGHTIGLPSELHIYGNDQDRAAVFIQSIIESGQGVNEVFGIDANNKNRNKIIQGYLERFSIVKRELLTEEEMRARYPEDEMFLPIFSAYQEALLESGGMDFDDILVFAHRIFLEQPWCGDIYRAKYQHVCIDEAQDLNRAQYEFIKAFCGNEIKSVMLVGDADQMIYGFNGSSSDYMGHSFVHDFSPVRFKLNENYRSSKAVIRLANKLKPGSQEVSDFVLDGVSQINSFVNEEAEADWIVLSIKNFLNIGHNHEIEGKITLSKMVVVGRNRFVFSVLAAKLKEAGLAFSLKQSERLVEPSSLIGRTLDFGIRVLINSRDWVDGRKLCQTLGIAEQEWGTNNLIAAIVGAVKNSDVKYKKIIVHLLEMISSLDVDQPNVPKLCYSVLAQISEAAIGADKLSLSDLENAAREVQDFLDAWTIYRRKGLGNTLSAFRNALALGQIGEAYEPEGLVLSTVHTMKGLERDIVFLMGMCEGVFPDYRARTPKEFSEELNSAFVAVTRARRWIYITYPLAKLMPWGDARSQSPSRFVEMMRQAG